MWVCGLQPGGDLRFLMPAKPSAAEMEMPVSPIASIAGSSAYAASTSELLSGTDTSSPSILDQMSDVVDGTSSNSTTSGSSDIVDLSDQAKTILEQARANKLASEKIDAFVQNGAQSQSAETNSALNGSSQQSTSTSSSSADSQAQTFQPFTPTQSLSKTVTYDGYTLTLNTDAGTQWYGIELSGNGVQAYDKHFGPSDQAAGGSGAVPGVEISAGLPDSNNEALDAITVTRTSATASNASISSSSGSAAASAASAQSSSITFLVNYKTGQISIEQSAASLSAQSVQSSSPGSVLSTLA